MSDTNAIFPVRKAKIRKGIISLSQQTSKVINEKKSHFDTFYLWSATHRITRKVEEIEMSQVLLALKTVNAEFTFE